MRFDRNLYAEAWRVSLVVWPYALMLVLGEYASEATLAVTGYAFSEGNELFNSFVNLYLWSLVAYGAHAEILLPAPHNRQFDQRRFLGFMLLITAVSLLAIVLFVLTLALLVGVLGVVVGAVVVALLVLEWIELPDPNTVQFPDLDAIIINLVLIPVLALGILLPLTVIGTVLPAHVANAGQGLKRAFHRGKQQLSWIAGQLVLGPGFVSIGHLALFFIPPLVLGWEGETVLLYGVDSPVLNATALAATLCQVYAIVITAVVLSRAYLRSEAAGGSAPASGEAIQGEVSATTPAASK